MTTLEAILKGRSVLDLTEEETKEVCNLLYNFLKYKHQSVSDFQDDEYKVLIEALASMLRFGLYKNDQSEEKEKYLSKDWKKQVLYKLEREWGWRFASRKRGWRFASEEWGERFMSILKHYLDGVDVYYLFAYYRQLEVARDILDYLRDEIS